MWLVFIYFLFFFYSQIFAICKKEIASGDHSVTLKEKGCQSINCASKSRGDSLVTSIGDVVHIKFRQNYTNKVKIQRDLKRKLPEPTEVSITSNKKSRLRSGEGFAYNKVCLFCGHGQTSKKNV